MLTTGQILGQPHHPPSTPTAPPRPAPSPAVQRAIDLIHAHADRKLTTRDLARAAALSERALRAGFCHALDTSPMAYLREIRLHRIRADLVSADPRAGITVSDLAHRWHLHPGRLGALYRTRFGELPSTTLHRPPTPRPAVPDPRPPIERDSANTSFL